MTALGRTKKEYTLEVVEYGKEDRWRQVGCWQTEKTANKHADRYAIMAGIKSVRVVETER